MFLFNAHKYTCSHHQSSLHGGSETGCPRGPQAVRMGHEERQTKAMSTQLKGGCGFFLWNSPVPLPRGLRQPSKELCGCRVLTKPESRTLPHLEKVGKGFQRLKCLGSGTSSRLPGSGVFESTCFQADEVLFLLLPTSSRYLGPPHPLPSGPRKETQPPQCVTLAKIPSL